MTERCCTPSQRDDDRTHTVHWSQSFYDGYPGDPPLWGDHGMEVACSHNDAVATAELVAARFDVPMKARGKDGTWIGSDREQGTGTRYEVWVARGPAEEDYDLARLSECEGGHR